MPYIANTPESTLPRSDSRSATVTCRGVTASGRPCRRALASSNIHATVHSPGKGLTPQGAELSVHFCWQHKDQAALYATETANKNGSPARSQRSSMDTIIDRLGILDIDDTPQRKLKGRERIPQQRRKTRWTFCCFAIADEDESDLSPSKSAQRHTASPRVPDIVRRQLGQNEKYERSHISHRKESSPVTARKSQIGDQRPKLPLQGNPDVLQAQPHLSWIPASLSARITSLLLAELAKPTSVADEAGYIYMFWATPTAPSPTSLPPQTQVRQLGVNSAVHSIDVSNILVNNSTPRESDTVRLKIGRTNNVQRRLNEWTRQCSHDLTLIRYYPYTSLASPSLPNYPASQQYHQSKPARKVPHVRRVERLIHIELDDIRVRDLGRCTECNRVHREWFEVPAKRAELRRVEECIRRWVQWGEVR